MESVFYGIETLKLNIMNSDRIKEIQQTTAYPESVSVKQALLQVWNECEQEQVKNCSIPAVSNRRELLLAYHEFYLKWRSSVSNSDPEHAVVAFLSKQ